VCILDKLAVSPFRARAVRKLAELSTPCNAFPLREVERRGLSSGLKHREATVLLKAPALVQQEAV